MDVFSLYRTQNTVKPFLKDSLYNEIPSIPNMACDPKCTCIFISRPFELFETVKVVLIL